MGTHLFGAGGSRRGRRMSIDNPLMSSWMRNSTNADSVSGSKSCPSDLPSAPFAIDTSNPAAVNLYQVSPYSSAVETLTITQYKSSYSVVNSF